MSEKQTQSRRVDLPLQVRLAPMTDIDVEQRTANMVWSTGSGVKRYDWEAGRYYWEVLSLEAGHVRLSRLNNGAPLLDTHGRWSLRDVLGVVQKGSAKVTGSEGRATVRFSKREEVDPIFHDVVDRIITNVSVGYAVHRMEQTAEMHEGLPVYRAVDWEPMEVSLVPIGADAGAGVRSDGQQAQEQEQRKYPCEIISTRDRAAEPPAKPANQPQEKAMTEAEKRAADEAAAKQRQDELNAAAEAARAAERQRVQDITELCKRHGMDEAFRDEAIKDGKRTVDAVRSAILDKLAEKTGKIEIRGGSYGDVHIASDQQLARRSAISEALFHRIAPTPGKDVSEGARQYRGMSLLRLAEEVLTQDGVSVRGMPAMQLATRSLMSTSDFPNILADVANKRLRAAYMEHVPTYTRWARRAPNAPDFKNINVTALAAAPALLKVVEGGEFTMGSLSDGKETYAILTYGRIIPLTRQAIINDDLNAFDRLPRSFSGAARRLENYTVYQILLANAALADGVALFHANHGNLPSAAAISATALGLARALMRKQTGLQSEKLNLSPKYLLAGPDKEQEAYQYTSSQFVPATPANVNEFRSGGRTALEPVIDAEITGNKWFLAADSADVDTVEYCYLDGSEGVYLESQMGFDVDGVKLKARLDFAAKAIDYRGLVYNSGA